MIELRHLRYFLEVAKLQHVTQAAQVLHVTQSTLSHQLRQLEEYLGTALFDRVGRGVRLTQAGETFLRYASRALVEVEAGQVAIDELHSLTRGRLRVGVIHTYTSTLLPPIIAAFISSYPGIQLSIDDLPAPVIEQKLVNGELDLGIAFAQTTRSEAVVEPLFSEKLVLVVRNDHPYARRNHVEAKDLAQIPLGVQTARFSSRDIIEQHLGHIINKSIRLEMGSTNSMLHAIRLSGMGGIVFECAFQPIEGLVKVPITNPGVTRTAALVWADGRTRTAAASKFAAAVVDASKAI